MGLNINNFRYVRYDYITVAIRDVLQNRRFQGSVALNDFSRNKWQQEQQQ